MVPEMLSVNNFLITQWIFSVVGLPGQLARGHRDEEG
jgi:hypothetical protein